MNALQLGLLRILAEEPGDSDGHVPAEVIKRRVREDGLEPTGGSDQILTALKQLEWAKLASSAWYKNGDQNASPRWRLTELGRAETKDYQPRAAHPGLRRRPSALATRMGCAS